MAHPINIFGIILPPFLTLYSTHLLSIQLTFLLPVNLVTGGGVLNIDGIAIYNYYTRGNIELSYDDYLGVEFGGALGAIFFYVSQEYITCTYFTFILSLTVDIYVHVDALNAMSGYVQEKTVRKY